MSIYGSFGGDVIYHTNNYGNLYTWKKGILSEEIREEHNTDMSIDKSR